MGREPLCIGTSEREWKRVSLLKHERIWDFWKRITWMCCLNKPRMKKMRKMRRMNLKDVHLNFVCKINIERIKIMDGTWFCPNTFHNKRFNVLSAVAIPFLSLFVCADFCVYQSIHLSSDII